MRIAIPFFEGMIFQHFGHAPQFKIYEVENKQVVMEMIVEPENRGHDAVAELLRSMDVRVVICGNIGASAIDALDAAGILFYGGVVGDADDTITQLIQGRLSYDPSIRENACAHHDHDHGHEGCGGCDSCGDDCGGDCSACAGCH